MVTTNTFPERGYEKHAWIIFFIVGILLCVPALAGMITGQPMQVINFVQSTTGMTWDELSASNPEIAAFIGLLALDTSLLQLTLAIFVMLVSLTAYRRGERWAWYAFWALLLFHVVLNELLSSSRYGISRGTFLFVFLVPMLLGLLLPYRKFFPKKQLLHNQPQGG